MKCFVKKQKIFCYLSAAMTNNTPFRDVFPLLVLSRTILQGNCFVFGPPRPENQFVIMASKISN